jgi:hypothetical protein
VYRKLLFVDKVSHDRHAARQAWKATLETTEHVSSPYCLWVWSAGRAADPYEHNYVYDLDRCPTGNVG